MSIEKRKKEIIFCFTGTSYMLFHKCLCRTFYLYSKNKNKQSISHGDAEQMCGCYKNAPISENAFDPGLKMTASRGHEMIRLKLDQEYLCMPQNISKSRK